MKHIDISTPSHPQVFALVDDADYEWLNKWKWSAEKRKNGFYAIRGVRRNGKNSTIRMHQFIAGATGIDIDHRDGNGLNNRRENLRPCTQAQNGWNVGKKRGSSKYKGVSWCNSFQRWTAHITANKKKINLGCFTDESHAAAAYNLAAIEKHGQFARINQGISLTAAEVAALRTPPSCGQNHSCSKITEEQAMDILYSTGLLREMAAKHGVSISTVSAIRHRKVWRHLPLAKAPEIYE